MSPEGKEQFNPEEKKPATENEEPIQLTAATTEELKMELFFDEKIKGFIKATIRKANRGAIPETDEEDVAQDVKAAVWRSIENGKFDQNKAKLTTYLFQAIRNKFIDIRRKQKNRHDVQLEEYNLADPGTPIEDWINSKYILGLILQLPSLDQEVLKLKSEGYKNREMAEKLKIPLGTIGNIYVRAIEKLKKIAAKDKEKNPK